MDFCEQWKVIFTVCNLHGVYFVFSWINHKFLKMTVTLIGPRSSTPKVAVPARALPKVPKVSNEPKKAIKGARALPPVPNAPRADGIKPSRSLPRVPGPVQAKSPLHHTSKHMIQNPAVPIVPKGARILPNIPKLNILPFRNPEKTKSGKSTITCTTDDTQDRKGQLHDVYKTEADDHLRKAELDKALDCYNAVSTGSRTREINIFMHIFLISGKKLYLFAMYLYIWDEVDNRKYVGVWAGGFWRVPWYYLYILLKKVLSHSLLFLCILNFQ